MTSGAMAVKAVVWAADSLKTNLLFDTDEVLVDKIRLLSFSLDQH